MKRLAFLALAPLFTSCASEQEFEIPTISVGEGGARALTNDGTPHDAYHKAYAAVLKKHGKIDRMVVGTSTARLFLDRSLESIVRNLEVMQGLLAEPAPATMDPLIAFYSELYQQANRGRLKLGTWNRSRISRRGKEISNKLNPEVVTLRKVETSPGDAPKKVSLPLPDEKEGEERIIRSSEPRKESSDAEYRNLYKAWSDAHAGLVEAFKKRAGGSTAYKEVTQALEKISGMLAAREANSLLVYRQFYARIYEETAAFTRSPEGAEESDVMNDLRIVFSGIQKELNPEKRK